MTPLEVVNRTKGIGTHAAEQLLAKLPNPARLVELYGQIYSMDHHDPNRIGLQQELASLLIPQEKAEEPPPAE